MATHKVAVSIGGDVFSAFCSLEGEEVDLFGSATGFARTFEALDITGGLDVLIHCKGLNGTDVNISVSVDGTEKLKKQGTINKGFFRVAEVLPIV